MVNDLLCECPAVSWLVLVHRLVTSLYDIAVVHEQGNRHMHHGQRREAKANTCKKAVL
jgi:hypothetical protein